MEPPKVPALFQGYGMRARQMDLCSGQAGKLGHRDKQVIPGIWCVFRRQNLTRSKQTCIVSRSRHERRYGKTVAQQTSARDAETVGAILSKEIPLESPNLSKAIQRKGRWLRPNIARLFEWERILGCLFLWYSMGGLLIGDTLYQHVRESGCAFS